MAITFSGITFSGGFQLDPAYVPDAPTIGTATTTGTTTATVTFTAPSYGGSSTITTYTATSSPGNITGTLSQAGSGTITVSGLTSSTSYTFTVTATNSNGTSVASAASNSITTDADSGQQAYTTAGTFSWTAPAGVTSVCVVCVGGGGGAIANTGQYGGAGGGLGWKNNITVVPGQSYTVVVGAAGISRNGATPTAGGDSYFIQNDSNSYCAGKGGYAGSSGGSGGGYYGDGGGAGGGAGGPYGWDGSYPYRGQYAGGGAGGYSPSSTNNAGQAQFGRTNDNSGSPAGGNQRYGGGGVGILGKGDTGLYGSNPGSGGDGGGGTGGGGAYGGGAGCWDSIYFGQPGGGAVRIIWGANRSFPSTNTGNV